MKKTLFSFSLALILLSINNSIYSQESNKNQNIDETAYSLLINQENSNFIKSDIDEYLISYIDSGNIQVVSYLLLVKKANPNYFNAEGITPLMTAVMKPDTNITKFLIRRGAFVNIPNYKGESALLWSVKKRQVNQLKVLIENNASVNIKDLNGISPIFYALGYSTYDLLNYANPDYLPLIIPDTSISTTYKLLQLLTKSGVDINLENDMDCTPLLFATFQKDTSLIRILCKLGADPNKPTSTEVPPIVYAIQDHSFSTVKALVEGGANINYKLIDGNSPFYIAVRSNNDRIAEYFLQKKALIDDIDNTSKTPLHYASGYGYPYMTSLLISHGANLNKTDNKGNTPLMSAVYSGALTVSEILIDSGADVNIADNHGNTPLMVAAQFNDTLLVEKLHLAGANIKALNDFGLNALNIAIDNNSIDAFKKLVELGANIDDSTLTESYYQQAKEKRSDAIAAFIQSKGLKTKVKPKISGINFYLGGSTSRNDFMLDFGFGVFEPVTIFLINFGYKYNPYSNRVLVYENSLFYQFWEKRYSFYLSIQHMLVLRNKFSKGNYGFIPGLSSELSWNKYRGYENNSHAKMFFVPSIGLFYKKNRFTLIGKWEFANYHKQIRDANRFNLQLLISIPTSRSYVNKRIDWLD